MDFVLEAINVDQMIHLAMKEEGTSNNNSFVNVAINNQQWLKKKPQALIAFWLWLLKYKG